MQDLEVGASLTEELFSGETVTITPLSEPSGGRLPTAD